MPKRLLHMLSGPRAEPIVFPYTSARGMLHAFPYQRLGVDVQRLHIPHLEDTVVFFQVQIDRRLRFFKCARSHGVDRIGRTSRAIEIPDSPLDHVGVEEHWFIPGLIGRVGLEHANPMRSAVHEHGL